MSKIVSLLIVVLLVCGSAVAGPLLNHPLAWTDGASRTWTGSTHIQNAGGTLSADIEWSVFGPDVCPYSDANFTPTAGEFVYAYQVVNQGTLEINKFWVNMKASNEANGIGYFDLTPGVAPSSAQFAGAAPNLVSADWLFAGNLTAGLVSDGLAYSSINAPIDWLGFIQNGGTPGTPQGALPSPGDEIPEPVTIALLLVGAGIFVALRRRRA